MPKKSGKSAAKSKRGAAKTAAKPAKPTRRPVKLPSAWQLAKQSAMMLWEHKQLFIGITLMYGLLNLVLVQGLTGGADISSLKASVNSAFSGHLGFLATGIGTFAVLVGTAGNNGSQTAGAYQMILAIISSLAIIWALRQVSLGKRPGIRDAYYRGMYPLIPFIIVLFVIGLQLVPLVVGSSVYTLVINNGIATHAIEKILWGLLAILLSFLTLYMLSSSLFALYIATLPDMTPMKALRSARELVRHRRWTVLRKLLCLPIFLLLVAAIVMVPLIIILAPLASWVFFLLTMFSLAAVHSYVYNLYRELLNE